jgi:hypothetical protein
MIKDLVKYQIAVFAFAAVLSVVAGLIAWTVLPSFGGPSWYLRLATTGFIIYASYSVLQYVGSFIVALHAPKQIWGVGNDENPWAGEDVEEFMNNFTDEFNMEKE